MAGARRQVIQDRPPGSCSARIRAEVIIPRSPTMISSRRANFPRTTSTAWMNAAGSAVLAGKTRIATGRPSESVEQPVLDLLAALRAPARTLVEVVAAGSPPSDLPLPGRPASVGWRRSPALRACSGRQRATASRAAPRARRPAQGSAGRRPFPTRARSRCTENRVSLSVSGRPRKSRPPGSPAHTTGATDRSSESALATGSFAKYPAPNAMHCTTYQNRSARSHLRQARVAERLLGRDVGEVHGSARGGRRGTRHRGRCGGHLAEGAARACHRLWLRGLKSPGSGKMAACRALGGT
jgi:hypothetical protein